MYQIRSTRPVYQAVVEEDRTYVRRPLATLIGGCFCIASGLGAGLLYWLGPIVPSERLGDAIFSGPVAAIVVWFGIAAGPLTSLRVSAEGLRVRNPLRRAFIPWPTLEAARPGTFGLRLDTAQFSLAVFAAQSSNASGGLSPAKRPIGQLADDLTAIRDHYRSVEPLEAQAAASIRWVAPVGVLLVVLTYSAATAWWVFR